MKRLLLVAALCLTSTACDQLARLTRLHSATPLVASAGEPGSVSAVGWAPSRDGRGFGTYVHDPTVANGCSEWNTEPAAELDNDGVLCRSFVP